MLLVMHPERQRQFLAARFRFQVQNGATFETLLDKTLAKYTRSAELISADSVHSGTMTELTYSVGLKRSDQAQELLTELGSLNGNNKVTLVAGYNGTDL